MSVLSQSTPTYRSRNRAAGQEAIRRRLVKLVFAIYFLLIFEGALRKWGVPQLEQVFYFIRVPVALVLYALAFRYGRWPRTSPAMVAFYMLAVAALVLVPVQLLIGSYDARYLVLAGYGWINYFFYIPMAFIIADQFRAGDISRLIRFTAWLAIPAAILVIWQFASSPHSVVNLGAGLDEDNQFRNLGAALGYVRPTGFFTSTTGQTQFVASAFALLSAAFFQRRGPLALRPSLLLAGGGAVVLMTVFSQSRSLFAMVALVLLATGAAGFVTGRTKILLRAIIWPAALAITVALLWPLLFPTSFEVFTARWTGAMSHEEAIFRGGFFGRLFYGFYDFTYYLPNTPPFGYILGLGGNASAQLSWVQLPAAATEWQGYGKWSEGGWARHITELGPVLGLFFIIFRVVLTVWLGAMAVRATRRSGNVLPMVLFGFVGISLLVGQITGQGTINGFAWMFFGFCLAAARTVHTPRRQTDVIPPREVER